MFYGFNQQDELRCLSEVSPQNHRSLSASLVSVWILTSFCSIFLHLYLMCDHWSEQKGRIHRSMRGQGHLQVNKAFSSPLFLNEEGSLCGFLFSQTSLKCETPTHGESEIPHVLLRQSLTEPKDLFCANRRSSDGSEWILKQKSFNNWSPADFRR